MLLGTIEKKNATESAKDEAFRVRLRPVTVPDDVFQLAESGLGAYDALRHADDPARSLFWRGREEALIPLAESLRYPEAVLRRILPLPVFGGVDTVQLPHHVACVVQSYTLLTPLDPGQPSLCSSPHQCLLDTWPRQELVVNFVRDWGRELPCSASRRLGYIVNLCRGPVSGLLAGPTCEPRGLQDPVPPHLLLDPPGQAACIVVVTFLGLGLHGCRHICSGRYCPVGTQFYQTKGTIVPANVSDGGRVTPIGGYQTKEDTHDVVLNCQQIEAWCVGSQCGSITDSI